MPGDRKRLVLCFDGTWNNLQSNTNVSRMYAEIADETIGDANQRKFYDEGVGTGMFDRIRGGVFGDGLDKNIRVGYAWLASVFEESGDPVVPPADPPQANQTVPSSPIGNVRRRSNGDLMNSPPHSSGTDFLDAQDIYLFGFSRGAFTARSLGGIINYLGIPKLDPKLTKQGASLADHPSITEAWSLYASRPTAEERQKPSATINAHDAKVANLRKRSRYPVRIHFVGVWDTVGSLGIPKVFDQDWIPRFSSTYQFHDTSLGECIRNAFHGLAIDEHRLPYTPTLWTAATPTTEAIQQRWFPGAHADVGGGYEDDLLPDPPLKWLADCAAACGLEFINDRYAQSPGTAAIKAVAQSPAAFNLDGREYLSPVHDSYADFLGGSYKLIRSIPGMGGPVYRRMLVAEDGINQTVDETAFAKWRADPDYRPPNLGQAGRTDVSFNTPFAAANATQPVLSIDAKGAAL